MSEEEWKSCIGITDENTVSEDDMEGEWEEIDEIGKEEFDGSSV